MSALPLSLQALDPKRIAGTSTAIALHVGVLMMLMIPMQLQKAAALPDEEITVLPDTVKKAPLPPDPEPRPIARPTVAPIVAPPQPPSAFVSDQLTPVSLPPVAINEDPPPVTTYSEPAPAALQTKFAPPPPYPAQAIRQNLTGTVVLRVLVDTNGRVIQAEIESSSGHTLLDRSAAKFVQSCWLFESATQNGQAVQAWARVPVVFVLGQ